MPGVAAQQPSGAAANMKFDEAITALVIDNSGRLIVGTADGQIFIEGGSPFPAHKGGITRLCPSPTDNLLISSGEDGRVLIHDEHETNQLLLGVNGWVEQLCWSPDGRLLAIAAGKRLLLFERRTDGLHEIDQWDDIPGVLSMTFAPDSRRLATAANKGLYLWRSGQDKPSKMLTFPGAAVALAWQPNGKALAVGTQDGFLQIWRQQTIGGRNRSAVLTMRGYPGKVNRLDWHPDRPLVATAGGSDVVIWDLSSSKGGKALALRDHTNTITALAWSPGGQFLAAGDRSGLLTIWNSQGQLLKSFNARSEISVLTWPTKATVNYGDLDGSLGEASCNTDRGIRNR